MGKTILTVTVILAAVVILAGCRKADDPGLVAAQIEATRAATQIEQQKQELAIERERLALERARTRAESVDAFLMALPWVILFVGLGACAIVAWIMLPILVQRLGLVTRKAEDGESLLLMGKHRIALPLRAAGPYLDLAPGAERAPLLAESAEAQAAATLRQQAANAILAQQAAKTVQARVGSGDVYLLPPDEKRERAQALPAPSPVRVLEVPTETVRGWLGDVQTVLLPEVINDGD
jgi:hypothetical protein